jgi:hypothetical protein
MLPTLDGNYTHTRTPKAHALMIRLIRELRKHPSTGSASGKLSLNSLSGQFIGRFVSDSNQSHKSQTFLAILSTK